MFVNGNTLAIIVDPQHDQIIKLLQADLDDRQGVSVGVGKQVLNQAAKLARIAMNPVIGAVAGLYPAVRAARLDPTEAVRPS